MKPVDPKQIQLAIEARESAELSMEFAEENIPPHEIRYWETLSKLVNAKLPESEKEKKPSDKMTDEESKRFEKQKIPFGEFKDRTVDKIFFNEDVRSRLEWYADEESFVDKLRRYLKADRVKRLLR